MIIGSRRTSIMIIAILIFSLMLVFSSPLSAALPPLVFAQTAATTSSNNMGSGSSNATMENMVLNLGTPLYIEHGRTTSITNITQNVSNATFVSNGTFMLPNGRNVSVIGLGYRLVNTTGGLIRVTGQSLVKTIDGKESALFNVAIFRPIINSTMQIGVAYIQINSSTTANTTTGQQQQQLASLNNTLGLYKSEIISPTEYMVTLWKWNPVMVSSTSQALSASPSISESSSSSINNTGMMRGLNLGTPLYIEHGRTTSITNITQNTTRETFEGNGTFMLPTPTERNVSTVDSGYDLINTIGGLVRVTGQSLVKTIDGKESATIDYARFTPANSTIGIGVGYIRTNSTIGQQLASLNNTLIVYKSEAISPTEGLVTFWKWR